MATPNIKDDQLQREWLLQQKLSALAAENRALKETLWSRRPLAEGMEDSEQAETISLVQGLIGDLITKAVFLSETQSTTPEVNHFLDMHCSLDPPKPKRRGRPPKKHIVNGHIPTKVSQEETESEKPVKRKNPYPRKCTIQPNTEEESVVTNLEPLPPRRQKLLAQNKVKHLKSAATNGILPKPGSDGPQEIISGNLDLLNSYSSEDDVGAFNDPMSDIENEPSTSKDSGSLVSIKKTRLRRKKGTEVISSLRKKHKKMVRHRCKLCNTTFTHGRPFKRHISGYPRGSCCCRLCHKEFISHAIFLHHICEAKRKIKGAPRTCRHCSEVFTNAKKYYSHLREIHQEKVGEPECFCKFCNRGFLKRITMYKHYSEHAPEGHTVCHKCGEFVTDTEEALDQHDKYHFEKANHICDKCGATFMRKQQYEQHMAAHQRYDCPMCDGRYSTRKALEKHQKLTHGIKVDYDRKRYYCDQCGKCFARPGLLEIHNRVHTGEKPIECTICHMYFRTPKALNKHKQTYTHMSRSGDVQKERDHLCQVCGKAYFRKQALQRHMRYHTGEKPYKCPHCDYFCRENNNLKRHIALHFSRRDYVCETCGAAFHAKKTLETHIVYKHSETRNFHCEECPLSFKTPNSLRRHKRIHANTRPHKCDWCGTGFNRLYNLRRHLRSVHGNDEGIPAPKRVKLLDVPIGLEFHKGSQAASTGQSPPDPPPQPKKRSKKGKQIINEPSSLPAQLPTTTVYSIDEQQLLRPPDTMVSTEGLVPAIVQNKPVVCVDTNLQIPVANNLNPQVLNQIVSNNVSMVHGYYQDPDGTVRTYTVAAPAGEADAANNTPAPQRPFPVTTLQLNPQNTIVTAEPRQDFQQDQFCTVPNVQNFLHFMQSNN